MSDDQRKSKAKSPAAETGGQVPEDHGRCPQCGSALECRARTGSATHNTATRFLHCPDCSYRRESVSVRGAPAQWPGLCPKCGAALKCHAVTASTSRKTRTRFLRCAKRCGFETKTIEIVSGPMPAKVPTPAA